MEVTLKSDLFNVRRLKREEESNQDLVEQKIFRPHSKETSPRGSPTTTAATTTATSSSPTTATSNNQKLRFSIAHIMGFMGGGGGQSSDVEVKEEDEEDEKTEEEEAVSRSNVSTQLPKLWRPQPNRDYIDFGAMALLSRQYSLFNQVSSFSQPSVMKKIQKVGPFYN